MRIKLAFFGRSIFRSKFKIGIFIAFLLLTVCAFSQDYKMKIYRVEDGLPTDVVKSVAQDSAGFLWIATDDGLVQFDGLRFTPFKNALHSQYAKGFYKTRAGKLLLFGDLDIIEIQNKLDTVIFKTIRKGGRNPTDSLIWYPKTLFEDSRGRLWISEPQSVVVLEEEKTSRYLFELHDRSPQFLRSFSFFENKKGEVFACSYSGNLYKLAGSKQEKQEVVFPKNVNAVEMHNNILWIAASDGIYSFDPEEAGPVRLRFRLAGPQAIKFLDDKRMMVGSEIQQHYIINIKNNQIHNLSYDINNVNSIFISKENDIWISSAEGLVLLQRNSFAKVEGSYGFVESIAMDSISKVIYYCTMSDLFRVKMKGTNQLVSEKIWSLPGGYFLSLQINDQGLWVANGFSVYMLKNEKLFKKWDFESEGRFIHDLFLDADQNLWLSQSGNTFISSITPDLKVKRYKIPLLQTSIVNCVRVNERGVYVAANGKDSYLFFKSKTDSAFESISLPVDFKTYGDFNVNDIAFTQDVMWLASSEGLLKYQGQKVQRIDLGQKYSTLSVKSVEKWSDDQLLFTNSYGLFRYEISTGNYWLFDEGNGLASNTITSRGIFIDRQKTVWVGTSKGLSFSREKINHNQKTTIPYFVEARVNGLKQRFSKGIHLDHGSFLNLIVTCVTFPESKVDIQYRIPKLENKWRDVEKNTLSLSELRSGFYTVEIRARKNGGYDWSEIQCVEVTVNKPFWQQPWFLIVIIFLVIIIFWFSFSIAARINQQRRIYLEKLVEQRTAELQRANEELKTRNSELDRFVYSASHDLSAPLKSLLGLINIAQMENPSTTHSSYLKMMEMSVKRMENFIKDVIHYSRNARVAVSYQLIDFKKLIGTIISDHQYSTNFGSIDFRVTINVTNQLVSDEMRLKIILNNLVSNAIKFQIMRNGRQPYIHIDVNEHPEHFSIKVSDNGQGIPPQMVEKVFDMFFRATDSVQGSGLGLYILKESVYKLDGKVEVSSSLGEGTIFTVSIPKISESILSLQ